MTTTANGPRRVTVTAGCKMVTLQGALVPPSETSLLGWASGPGDVHHVKLDDGREVLVRLKDLAEVTT